MESACHVGRNYLKVTLKLIGERAFVAYKSDGESNNNNNHHHLPQELESVLGEMKHCLTRIKCNSSC